MHIYILQSETEKSLLSFRGDPLGVGLSITIPYFKNQNLITVMYRFIAKYPCIIRYKQLQKVLTF